MMTVWKYPLPIYNDVGNVCTRSLIYMPEGAEVLTFRIQDEEYCIWAEVDKATSMTPRAFQIVGTGDDLPTDRIEGGGYVGTVLERYYVWHLFEVVFPPHEDYDLRDYATITREEAYRRVRTK